MLRSELIVRLQAEYRHLGNDTVEKMVDEALERIAAALEKGDRVEIRGFGAFSVRSRGARIGRNPRTGEAVEVEAKRVPFFKPGKELRERVNAAAKPAKASRASAAKKAAPEANSAADPIPAMIGAPAKSAGKGKAARARPAPSAEAASPRAVRADAGESPKSAKAGKKPKS